jgi:hypothetical protein
VPFSICGIPNSEPCAFTIGVSEEGGWIIDLSNVSLIELGMGVLAVMLVVVVSWVLWRILKRAIGGCISMGIGCLVLIVGVIAVALYFASRYGITNFQDVLKFVGF